MSHWPNRTEGPTRRRSNYWAERAVALDRDHVGGQGHHAAAAAELRRLRPGYRIATFRDGFSRYSTVPAFLAGQPRCCEGLCRAGPAA